MEKKNWEDVLVGENFINIDGVICTKTEEYSICAFVKVNAKIWENDKAIACSGKQVEIIVDSDIEEFGPPIS